MYETIIFFKLPDVLKLPSVITWIRCIAENFYLLFFIFLPIIFLHPNKTFIRLIFWVTSSNDIRISVILCPSSMKFSFFEFSVISYFSLVPKELSIPWHFPLEPFSNVLLPISICIQPFSFSGRFLLEVWLVGRTLTFSVFIDSFSNILTVSVGIKISLLSWNNFIILPHRIVMLIISSPFIFLVVVFSYPANFWENYASQEVWMLFLLSNWWTRSIIHVDVIKFIFVIIFNEFYVNLFFFL